MTSYSTNYALYVHEALDVHHDVGQAKYLEQPARQLANDGTLAGIVVRVYTATRDLGKSLLATMLRVQRDSQKLVPVDTGTLKNSAQTQLEGRR